MSNCSECGDYIFHDYEDRLSQKPLCKKCVRKLFYRKYNVQLTIEWDSRAFGKMSGILGISIDQYLKQIGEEGKFINVQSINEMIDWKSEILAAMRMSNDELVSKIKELTTKGGSDERK